MLAGAPQASPADDCAVIVAIGRAELGWSDRSPPDHDYFAEGHAACDWRSLGVTPPLTGGPSSQRGFAISRPSYDGARATATLSLSVRARGQVLAPFSVRKRCELTRGGTGWVLLACRQGMTT